MLGQVRWDPATGAPLTDEKVYPPYEVGDGSEAGGRSGVRSPEYHPDASWETHRDEALTNGELESSAQGLLGYFRRAQRKVRDPNPAMDGAAALAVKRIKAGEDGILDYLAWLVLGERLARKGYWATWMVDHFQPRCPHCLSRCKFKQAVDPIAFCASDSDHGEIDPDIRERVCETYNATFADASGERIESIDDLRIV